MRIMVTGGGTGGHIYPGIAIAKYIKEKMKDAEIVFVGTKDGLERQLIPNEGFAFETIRVRGFKHKLSLDNIRVIKELILGLRDAKRIIGRFKPDVVIGTGGYASGPVIFMASLNRIPTLIHEQNVLPGITNRILGRFAARIAVSFKESYKYFPKGGKVILTGNPVRREFFTMSKNNSRVELGLKVGVPTVLGVGGSRGALRINQVMVELIDDIIKNRKNIQVIHSTGDKQYDRVIKEFGMRGIRLRDYPNIKVKPYIKNMAQAITCADLVVSRAGAIALAEITAAGKPAVLVPSPHVTGNHQEYNARALEKEGAAIVLLERDLHNGSSFMKVIYDLLGDRNKLNNMERNSRAIAPINAVDRIYKEICALVSKAHDSNTL